MYCSREEGIKILIKWKYMAGPGIELRTLATLVWSCTTELPRLISVVTPYDHNDIAPSTTVLTTVWIGSPDVQTPLLHHTLWYTVYKMALPTSSWAISAFKNIHQFFFKFVVFIFIYNIYFFNSLNNLNNTTTKSFKSFKIHHIEQVFI